MAISIFAKIPFPGSLMGLEGKSLDPSVTASKYYAPAANGRLYRLKISAVYYKALRAFAEQGNLTTFFGEAENGDVVIERVSPGYDTQIIVYSPTEQTVRGAIVDPATGRVTGPYVVRDNTTTDGADGTALVAAFLPSQMAELEALNMYADMSNNGTLSSDPAGTWRPLDTENLVNGLCVLCDNFYRRTAANHAAPGTPKMPGWPTENRDIIPLTGQDLRSLVCANKIAGPDPSIIKMTAPSVAPSEAANEDAPTVDLTYFGHPDYSGTPFKKADLPEGFRWAKWIKDFVFDVLDSFRYNEPLKVAYLVGPAGCGKTVGTVGIANALGLGRIVKTCGPDTDLFSFFGEILPNTGNRGNADLSAIAEEMGLPRLEDVSGAEVLDVVTKVFAEAGRRFNDYKFVEGPLTKALRYGLLLEIQEVGIIRRPGVVVGLNDVLETGKEKTFILPTGEEIKADPHCIIIFTSNDEYEGTANLNQSVLSRMGQVLYFENPTPEAMAARTKGVVTDWTDTALLLKMAQAIATISDTCRDSMVTDGVCGQRELTNWAMRSMSLMRRSGESKLTNEIIRQAAQTTVLNKVSQDRENILDVAQKTINKIYGDCCLTVGI